MSNVIYPGDTVFVRTYIPQWLAQEMAAIDVEIESQLARVKANSDLYEPRLKQLRAERAGLVEQGDDIRDTARAQLESLCSITLVDLSEDPLRAQKYGQWDDFPEIVAVYRGGHIDSVAEFGPFIERHLARKGQVSTEEMAALYEDFHGIALKKEEGPEEK